MQTKSSTAATTAFREEETLCVSDNTITVKIGGKETGNAYSLFELSVPPEVGAGLHIDQDWDEFWHVMEGTFAFTLNGEKIELSSGGFAYGPKGIPHSFKNVGNTTGKLVMLTRPSGLENFFKTVHEASLDGKPDKETFVKMMRSYHIEPA
ncbi:MAG TPA: cupin domain-containing protein [Hanamia sp.]|nr:cupin domain-containing protein [Hanamia sp.]